MEEWKQQLLLAVFGQPAHEWSDGGIYEDD